MPVTNITISPAGFTAHSDGMFNTTTAMMTPALSTRALSTSTTDEISNTTTTMSTPALSTSSLSTSPTGPMSNKTTTTSPTGESISLFDGITAKTWTTTSDIRADANKVCGLMSKVKNLQLHLQFLTDKLGKCTFLCFCDSSSIDDMSQNY